MKPFVSQIQLMQMPFLSVVLAAWKTETKLNTPFQQPFCLSAAAAAASC